MEEFYNASRMGKPRKPAPAPVYSPPVKKEFIPAGPNVTGMGRSRRRKLKGKKTAKGGKPRRR